MPNACPSCGFPLDPGAACARCARAATSTASTTTEPPVPDAQSGWTTPAAEPAPAPPASNEDTGSRRRNAALDIAPVTGRHTAPRTSPDPTPKLWLRAAAFGVDLGAVIVIGLLFYTAGAVAYGLPELRAAGGGSALAGALELLSEARAAGTACALLLFALTSGYFVWFPGAESRTPGMALFGLRVVRTDGTPLGMAGAIQRWGAFLFAGALFGLGILWTAFSDVQRGLHDHLAGTHVVRT